MNPDFRVLPEVAADIFDIWRFIAEDNVEAANRVGNEIWDVFAELAKFPEMGHEARNYFGAFRGTSADTH